MGDTHPNVLLVSGLVHWDDQSFSRSRGYLRWLRLVQLQAKVRNLPRRPSGACAVRSLFVYHKYTSNFVYFSNNIPLYPAHRIFKAPEAEQDRLSWSRFSSSRS